MNARLALAAALALASSACAHRRELVDGGVIITRTGCPQAGIPAGTGDVTLFDPAGSTDSSAIDVSATITNLRASCVASGNDWVSTVDFDVVANRRDRAAARTVALPYFDVILQGGESVAAKHVGQAVLEFPAGADRASVHLQTTGRVSRSAATLPADIQRRLAQPRKAGDADAAVDPLADPTTREAVARATFEQLVGFQLTQDQLKYNATR
ncbi:hypothetical protein ABDK56_00460 [Sphingomonas sp. ASV193]|uniref:hypothetical protein n=1 Tax=Sphingomonas sp. ASV193 TaxID=3144405 RepID=UPI0032E8A781